MKTVSVLVLIRKFCCSRFVVVLAKDLREEFYPYFKQFLCQLIKLLDDKDPDQQEWTLVCLAFLFKTLKPFLKKDITIVFNSILPLLSRRSPEHVQNFAAECFSFVARDIKDKQKFLLLIIEGLKRNSGNHTGGCGRLLFECMKGINGTLHSSAQQFLDVTLAALANEAFEQNLLYDVVRQCLISLLHNTEPANMTIFWSVSHRTMETYLLDVKENDVAIQKLLSLMELAIEFKHSRYLSGIEQMIGTLMRICDADGISSDTLMLAAHVTAIMLLSPNLNITQLDASRLTQKILTRPCRKVFETFVWNVVHYAQFEILVLPEFLKYFQQYYTADDRQPLELLTKIILTKSPLSLNGIDIHTWKRYPIHFRSETTLALLENVIRQDSDTHHLVSVLIVYPHILGVDGTKVADILQAIVNRLCAVLNTSLTENNVAKLRLPIFTLAIVTETLVHLQQHLTIDVETIITTLLPYTNWTEYAPILNIIDMLLATCDKSLLTVHLFETIHSKLVKNLSSHSHRVRRLTTHIFGHFNTLETLGKLPGLEVFQICFQVESIEANIQTYREQLRLLQKLAADMQLSESVREMSYGHDPLRYVIFGF